MFIATRTKTGKEVHTDSQLIIDELQNHQNSGKTTDDAFKAVFGKEQPGRLRCYSRSVTASSPKRDEETKQLKQKHANEVTSLKEVMREMREEMQHIFSQLVQNNPPLNVQDIPGYAEFNLPSPDDASSARAVRGQTLPNSSNSTRASILKKCRYEQGKIDGNGHWFTLESCHQLRQAAHDLLLIGYLTINDYEVPSRQEWVCCSWCLLGDT
ncbi:uncharacterized protein LOC107860413 isoform X4 [Capsicum annuum]|nr:uncharacterized protein LOC107860413 isoform X4 [Capsicum annuum]